MVLWFHEHHSTASSMLFVPTCQTDSEDVLLLVLANRHYLANDSVHVMSVEKLEILLRLANVRHSWCGI
jgi:hypothetical protein